MQKVLRRKVELLFQAPSLQSMASRGYQYSFSRKFSRKSRRYEAHAEMEYCGSDGVASRVYLGVRVYQNPRNATEPMHYGSLTSSAAAVL